MMQKWILLCGICLVGLKVHSQNFAIKSNILYDATTTINLGVEFALTDRLTLDISGNYNPWKFSQGEKEVDGTIIPEHTARLKYWMIQPELRLWTCEKFQGHFIGFHGQVGQFNVGGLTSLPGGWGDGTTGDDGEHIYDGVQYKRFQGWITGAGVSYGYHWMLTDRFSLEFTLGLGYAYLSYDKFGIQDSDLKEASKYMHYFGPTKAGITAVFMLK
ncbi:MAG: DUF3575 domain-containing protein [Tannerella sp.]|nr:DUF3575 domain-containing protein [Tannerella sp.]